MNFDIIYTIDPLDTVLYYIKKRGWSREVRYAKWNASITLNSKPIYVPKKLHDTLCKMFRKLAHNYDISSPFIVSFRYVFSKITNLKYTSTNIISMTKNIKQIHYYFVRRLLPSLAKDQFIKGLIINENTSLQRFATNVYFDKNVVDIICKFVESKKLKIFV